MKIISDNIIRLFSSRPSKINPTFALEFIFSSCFANHSLRLDSSLDKVDLDTKISSARSSILIPVSHSRSRFAT